MTNIRTTIGLALFALSSLCAAQNSVLQGALGDSPLPAWQQAIVDLRSAVSNTARLYGFENVLPGTNQSPALVKTPAANLNAVNNGMLGLVGAQSINEGLTTQATLTLVTVLANMMDEEDVKAAAPSGKVNQTYNATSCDQTSGALRNTAGCLAYRLASPALGITDPYVKLQAGATLPMISAPNPKDAALNFANFIGQTQYCGSASNCTGAPAPSGESAGSSLFPSNNTAPTPNSTQELQAKNFIEILSGLGAPLTAFTQDQYNSIKGKSPKSANEYLNSFRQFSAIISLGINNFQHMYQRRVGQAGFSGSFAADSYKTKYSGKLSQADVDEYMATRRFGNLKYGVAPTWYNTMETQPSIVLQRETLYLLAEMNYQLYQMRMLQERMLATSNTDLMVNANSLIKSSMGPAAGTGTGTVVHPGSTPSPKSASTS